MCIPYLSDRDKELNGLVQSHHKQLVSWEVDRERMSSVEKQLIKVKTEYKKRHEQCKLLKVRNRLQTIAYFKRKLLNFRQHYLKNYVIWDKTV